MAQPLLLSSFPPLSRLPSLLSFPSNTCHFTSKLHTQSSKNNNSLVLCSKARASSQLQQLSSSSSTTHIPGPSHDDELLPLPSSPLPDFSTTSRSVTLLTPCQLLPESLQHIDRTNWPLLVYVPGMDCTGQGIRNQLPYLATAGYDVRCVYIPSSDRSSWKQLLDVIIPLLKEDHAANGVARHITLVGESFGGPLALRLARAAPDIVSRLVLVNPATNFQESNTVGSFFASTGLLAMFPKALYEVAQDILLPLMLNRNRVSMGNNEEILSSIDHVPAACAAWRLSLLNDVTGLSEFDISCITVPTLLLCAAEDHVLSSVAEGGRLQRLLPNAKRVILPYSGHTVLLEDSVNLALIMEAHGFQSPKSSVCADPSSSTPVLGHLQNEGRAETDDMLDELGRLLEPWRILTSPLVSGEENLPGPETQQKRPLLFVGNHTIFGAYDTPLLLHELFLRGFVCRGLAHPSHWATFVGSIFERYGHVKATKFAAYRLLKEGENVLLFPGGAREVCKRKGEEYKLFWKPRSDFVRMASRFNAIIIPFAALGGDDAYKILWDSHDLLSSPVGPLLQDLYRKLGLSTDSVYPVTAIPGTNLPSFLALPSIERIYFHFAEPIDTANYGGSLNDRDKYNTLYLLVKERVNSSINFLKRVRANDSERDLLHRLLQKAQQVFPDFKRS